MKFTYPAIIRKQDNGTWKAWLPDLACCEAVGDTLDDAIEEVNAAVYDWISLELSEDEADLPAVRCRCIHSEPAADTGSEYPPYQSLNLCS